MLDKTILSGAINKKFTDFSDSIQTELHKRLSNHEVFKNYATEFDKIQSTKMAYADINEMKMVEGNKFYFLPVGFGKNAAKLAIKSLKKVGIKSIPDDNIMNVKVEISTPKVISKLMKWMEDSGDYAKKEIESVSLESGI